MKENLDVGRFLHWRVCAADWCIMKHFSQTRSDLQPKLVVPVINVACIYSAFKLLINPKRGEIEQKKSLD